MQEVLLFTKQGCPHCAAAKEDFRRRGIAYRELDAQGDAEALRRMLELNGGRRFVPTIVEGDRVTVGFDGY
ncbi:MAG TPA: glutaredoxin family protein [Anaerolineae bacterium]|nr:glutaredoxin family protein [Anaerolineae bacterium]